MIRRAFGGILLMEDVVKSVEQQDRDRVCLAFEGTTTILDVRNNEKKSRADLLRKMKLRAGERVLVIGAKDRISPIICRGFDVVRSGFVKTKGAALYKGTVERAGGGFFYLRYADNKKSILVKLPSAAGMKAFPGDEVACIVSVTSERQCPGKCVYDTWSLTKCRACTAGKTVRSYTALDMELISKGA